MSTIQHGIPFAEYLKIPAVSAHGLMLMARSMAHYRYAIETPSEPTPAQALGTHVHGLVLEPANYRYAIIPDCDRRTKAGKETHAAFLAESKGANTVTAEQHQLALAMREAVLAQPFARALLEDGHPEVTMQWTADGVDCKARADFIPSGHAVLVDLKTAQDASLDGFSRAAGRFLYHIQAAFYRRGADACELGPRPMIFIVVESDPPHGVALYQLDEYAVGSADVRIDVLLERYRQCRDSGQWPGYATEIQNLSLPKWSV